MALAGLEHLFEKPFKNIIFPKEKENTRISLYYPFSSFKKQEATKKKEKNRAKRAKKKKQLQHNTTYKSENFETLYIKKNTNQTVTVNPPLKKEISQSFIANHELSEPGVSLPTSKNLKTFKRPSRSSLKPTEKPNYVMPSKSSTFGRIDLLGSLLHNTAQNTDKLAAKTTGVQHLPLKRKFGKAEANCQKDKWNEHASHWKTYRDFKKFEKNELKKSSEGEDELFIEGFSPKSIDRNLKKFVLDEDFSENVTKIDNNSNKYICSDKSLTKIQISSNKVIAPNNENSRNLSWLASKNELSHTVDDNLLLPPGVDVLKPPGLDGLLPSTYDNLKSSDDDQLFPPDNDVLKPLDEVLLPADDNANKLLPAENIKSCDDHELLPPGVDVLEPDVDVGFSPSSDDGCLPSGDDGFSTLGNNIFSSPVDDVLLPLGGDKLLPPGEGDVTPSGDDRLSPLGNYISYYKPNVELGKNIVSSKQKEYLPLSLKSSSSVRKSKQNLNLINKTSPVTKYKQGDSDEGLCSSDENSSSPCDKISFNTDKQSNVNSFFPFLKDNTSSFPLSSTKAFPPSGKIDTKNSLPFSKSCAGNYSQLSKVGTNIDPLFGKIDPKKFPPFCKFDSKNLPAFGSSKKEYLPGIDDQNYNLSRIKHPSHSFPHFNQRNSKDEFLSKNVASGFVPLNKPFADHNQKNSFQNFLKLHNMEHLSNPKFIEFMNNKTQEGFPPANFLEMQKILGPMSNYRNKKRCTDTSSETNTSKSIQPDALLSKSSVQSLIQNVSLAQNTSHVQATNVSSSTMNISVMEFQRSKPSENKSEIKDNPAKRKHKNEKKRAQTREYFEKRKLELQREAERKKHEASVPCPFYTKNRYCDYGDDCRFSHDVEVESKISPCKFYTVGACRKGDQCLFMHEKWPCRFFHLYKRCDHGNLCKFSHDEMTPDIKKAFEEFENTRKEELQNSLQKEALHVEAAPPQSENDPIDTSGYQNTQIPSEEQHEKNEQTPDQFSFPSLYYQL